MVRESFFFRLKLRVFVAILLALTLGVALVAPRSAFAEVGEDVEVVAEAGTEADAAGGDAAEVDAGEADANDDVVVPEDDYSKSENGISEVPTTEVPVIEVSNTGVNETETVDPVATETEDSQSEVSDNEVPEGETNVNVKSGQEEESDVTENNISVNVIKTMATPQATAANEMTLTTESDKINVTVRHFRQNVDGSWDTEPDHTWVAQLDAGTTLNSTTEANREMGTLGTTDTTYFNPDYIGFCLDSSKTAASYIVSATDTVYDIYYKRGQYRVHYMYAPSVDENTANPTGTELQNAWISAPQYFENNYIIRPEKPVFQIYGDSTLWQLRKWYAQWDANQSSILTNISNDPYEFAFFQTLC